MSDITETIGNIEKAASAASGSMDSFNESLLKTGKGIDAIRNLSSTFSGLTTAIGAVGEKFPLIGGGIGGLTKGLSGLADGFSKTIGAGQALVGSYDGMSGYFRGLDTDVYNTMAGFGLTFNEARKLSDQLSSIGSDMSNADFGFQNVVDVRAAYLKFAEVGIPLEKLSSTIRTSSGDFQFMAVAMLQAKAAGLEMSQYVGYIENAVRNQGLTMQEATEQVAMFSQVSKETGLSIEDVATTLNGVASGYTKIGISANFARPLMEGFGRTLKGMGLGIKDSVELTQSFTKALASIPTDYSKAFITAQRGGLNIPGGAGAGVLNPAIQMQARLLRAQRNEGGESQEDISRELAKGMKDTIASFAGGSIVTVEQAANDTGLQQAFYTQTEMLKSLYGMNDDSAIRTLDLLSDLDKALASGDVDLATEIGKQMDAATEAENSTKSSMDKLNAIATGQLSQAMTQTRLLSDQLTITGTFAATMLGVDMEKAQETISKSIKASVDGSAKQMEGLNEVLSEEQGKGMVSYLASQFQGENPVFENMYTPNENGENSSEDGSTTLIGKIDDLIVVIKGLITGKGVVESLNGTQKPTAPGTTPMPK